MMTPTVRANNSPHSLASTFTYSTKAFTERVKAEAAGIPNLKVIVRDTGTFPTWAHDVLPNASACRMGLAKGHGQYTLTLTESTVDSRFK